MFVVVLTTISMTYEVIIPNSYGLTSPVPTVDYNEQKLLQQEYLWQLGKNLSVGDSYTYKICDPKTIQTSAQNYHYFTQGNDDHNSSTCYTIKLDFVNLLTSDENQINERDVWVVQAAISDISNKEIRYSIFHTNTQTFEVTSADTIHPDTKKYTDSLQQTLFSLHKYTAPEPQLLQIGAGWGEVTEALQERGENPQMTVLDNNQEFSVTQNHIRMIDKQNISVTRDIPNAFQVGYEIDIVDSFISNNDRNQRVEDTNNVTTFFLISSSLSFPLYAESYNPVYVIQPQKQFEFQLISFMTNNKNIDFEKSIIDESIEEDNNSDLPIAEKGTIELIIPPDDDISQDDDVDTVPEDDDLIPEEDDKELPDDGTEVIPEDDVEITPNNDEKIDNISNDIITNDDQVDYSKIGGLAVLLIVMIAGFLVFKRFRESRFKNILKKQKPQQRQPIKKIIIPFDEKLHIDIKIKYDNLK